MDKYAVDKDLLKQTSQNIERIAMINTINKIRKANDIEPLK